MFYHYINLIKEIAYYEFSRVFFYPVQATYKSEDKNTKHGGPFSVLSNNWKTCIKNHELLHI